MSLVRFSSDAFKSDVYIYEADKGWVVHVASQRYVHPDGTECPRASLILLRDDPEAWKKEYEAQHKWLEEAEMVPIGGEHDGASWDHIKDCEDMLRVATMLKEGGYHVPEYAFDSIREEIELQDKQQEEGA